MKRFIKKAIYFITVLAVAGCLHSCEKDDTLMYNNATLGNVVDGRFISDQGNIFNFVEQLCSGDITTMTRAMVVCDVLNKTASGESNEYDVRVTQIAKVLAKNIVFHENVNDDMLVQDPIHIEYAWISGGYMNLYIMFPIKVASTTSHLINLVHEGAMIDPQTNEEISGTYRFSLRHNSFGDKATSDSPMEYALAGGYVSFPLNNYITEKEADLSIEWVYRSGDGENEEDTGKRAVTARYKSDGFQHAPQGIALQTMSRCKVK